MNQQKNRIFALFFAFAAVCALALLTWAAQPARAQQRMIEASAPDSPPVIDDFEDGVPVGFVPFLDAWDGSGSSSMIALGIGSVGVPQLPFTSTNEVISVTYDIATTGAWGPNPGYGGVTRDFDAIVDWTGWDGFSLWFLGSNSGLEHRIELKSSGGDSFNSNRFQWAFTDDSEGWRYLNIPFADFEARMDFNPGPGGPLDMTAMWGYSVLLGVGAGSMQMDQVALTHAMPIHDFENGVPDGFVPFLDAWDGSGSGSTLAMELGSVGLPVAPFTSTNEVISVTYNVATTGAWGPNPGYGGVSYDSPAMQDLERL